MPVRNAEVADLFDRYAVLLEIGGANPFRVRAYRTAARTLRGLPERVAGLVKSGADLTDLPGIGKDLAAKIAAIVASGRFAALEELEQTSPPGLAELTRLPGLGAKRVRALHDSLHIESMAELRKAAEAGRVQTVEGFGPRSEARILKAIQRYRAIERRTRLADAEEIAGALLEHLRALDGVKRVVVAGSYRRRRETVGDLDILATCREGAGVMNHFIDHGDVAEVVSRGKTRSTVLLRSGLQVDLRVVPDESYGAALHYFTGSRAHNIAIRRMAAARGLKLNEYGLFRGRKRIGGRREEEVFKAVRLPYIAPELRENRGEIEAAQKGRLPRLVTLDDIRGDLHVHTRASDGHDSIQAMAQAARARGYGYLAICDHSKRVTVAHGLDARRLSRQMERIDRLNEGLRGFRILKSAEVDILEDGSLDLPDAVLARLDLTVCAVHYRFDLSTARQTERIIRAMDNPHFAILAHPTGRLIGSREPYAVDMERLLDAALERGCFLEVNGQPDRLDLNDVQCRLAKERGVKVALSTDAHRSAGLALMRHGVDQARRGWIEPDDVLNTRSWRDLARLLKRT